MSPKEAIQVANVIELPSERFDPTGLFWLNPDVIEDVDTLINSTRLSTMSLGAETHIAEMRATRELMKDILVPADDPLREESLRALDIGYMYGSLIALKSHRTGDSSTEAVQADQIETLPMQLLDGLEKTTDGLNPYDTGDSFRLFMRLRDLEVQEAHSDILAFSLASTQDHMRQEFERNHQSAELLSSQELGRLQTMFYAGTLVGALLSSDERDLAMPKIEIIQSMIGYVEPLAARMEFKQSDAGNLVATLGEALSSKLLFSVHASSNGESFAAVLPGGLQYGPNILSLPHFTPSLKEPFVMKKVPIKDVDVLFVAKQDPESEEVESLVLVEAPANYFADPLPDTKIVGLLLDNLCCSSYDLSHPNATVLQKLVLAHKGEEARKIKYTSGLAVEQNYSSLSLVKLSAVAVAGIWAIDALASAATETTFGWELDTTLSALVLVLAGIRSATKRFLKKNIPESDRRYQNMLERKNAVR